MTRLLNPTPGEICDRSSILYLKILHGREQGVPVEHFEEESRALAERLGAWFLSAGPDRDHYVRPYREQLGDINRRLWDLEAEVRQLPDPTKGKEYVSETEVFRLAELAKLISFLNDQRSSMIWAINKLFGIDHQEKIYASRTPTRA